MKTNYKKSIFIATLAFLGLSNVANAQVMIKDINPGSCGSSPQSFTDINGILFFTTTDENCGNNIYGKELWKSDGTSNGTVMVKDINPGSGGAFTFSTPMITNVNGICFFQADNGVNGIELWKSDGTDTGTIMVKDINPDSGIGGLASNQIGINLNGIFFFSADDGVNGLELWKSDGTNTGTVMVKDINPGISGSDPTQLTVMNGLLFFSAKDAISGQELWKTDGTDSGTVLVKDINSGTGSSKPVLSFINGILYMSADGGSTGRELWKSDGTSGGTVLIKDIWPWNDSNPVDFTEFNGLCFFRAKSPGVGYELWKTDGTDTGTTMVLDIYTGSLNSWPEHFAVSNGILFFKVGYSENDEQLWKSDGTASGTVMVKDFQQSSSTSIPDYLTDVNGKLFFRGNIPGVNNTVALWMSDGTPSGTQMVDLCPGCSSDGSRLISINGIIYLVASDGVNGGELWKLDPSTLTSYSADDITNKNINFFPNPTTGKFIINSSHENITSIRVYNIMGTMVLHQSYKNEIDLSNSPKGIYFVKIYDGAKIYYQKIVVQ